MTQVLLSPRTLQLINRFQRQLPFTLCPYYSMAQELGWAKDEVLDRLQRLHQQRVLSRVGPVFDHRQAGASTLVTMQVPSERLDEVAAQVSAYDEVNHNYEREHRFNLWFVLTAPNQARLDQVLEDIAQKTGLTPLSLPMVRGFHIDLGFPLSVNEQGQAQILFDMPPCARQQSITEPTFLLSSTFPWAMHNALRQWLENGLPLQPYPWRAFAQLYSLHEEQVLAQVQQWAREGLFRRSGLIIHHRRLGIKANLMLVIDVDDAHANSLGQKLAQAPGITLCYQRQRRRPDWPYNLFCMIHGHDRKAVEHHAKNILARYGLSQRPHQFLFSRRAFKQRGGRYVEVG